VTWGQLGLATDEHRCTQIVGRQEAIPNLVDVEMFKPAEGNEKKAARAGFGIPADAFVVGSAAAVKKSHKRLDYLVHEFAEYAKQDKSRGAAGNPLLVIAGSRTAESDGLLAMAGRDAPDRVKFFLDTPYDKMPDFYRALDVFVLPSLFEMMPIAVIEAMASGIPVILNEHPVLRWIGGEGGTYIDMAKEGALAGCLDMITRNRAGECGRLARERAVEMFSSDVVVGQIIRMYQAVAGQSVNGN
jgi:glycosyltransferase involved in cell wall biosynthesis